MNNDDMEVGFMEDLEDKTTDMTYHCSNCKVKHAGSGCLLPCCDAYVCQTSFIKQMSSSRYSVTKSVRCPECTTSFPTFLRLSKEHRITPIWRINSLFFRMLLAVGEVASWAISPGLAIAFLILTFYVIMNAFGVCVASSMFTSGYCFESLSFLHAFVIAHAGNPEVQMMMSFATHPVVFWGSFVCISAFCSLFLMVCGSEICRRLSSTFRHALQNYASLYYNPHTLF